MSYIPANMAPRRMLLALTLVLAMCLQVFVGMTVVEAADGTTITIVKEAEGSTEHDEFEFEWTGSNGTSGTISRQGAGSVTLPDPKQQVTYTITETIPGGWALKSVSCIETPPAAGKPIGNKVSNGIEFTTKPNQSIICTFVNEKLGDPPDTTPPNGDEDDDEADGKIRIIKRATPDTHQEFDFIWHSTEDNGGFTISHTSPSEAILVPAGGLTVTEVIPDGWSLVDVQCENNWVTYTNVYDDNEKLIGINVTDVKIAGNQDVRDCTFYNTQTEDSEPTTGTIIIRKEAPGASRLDHFTFDVTKHGKVTTWGASDEKILTELDPGDYTITERDKTGWFPQGVICDNVASADPAKAEVSLKAGQTITCTFTNAKGGSLKIIKLAPKAQFLTERFSFTVNKVGSTSTRYAFGKAGFFLVTDIEPGTKVTVTEQEKQGWEIGHLACTGEAVVTGDKTIEFTPEAGQSAICTFVNKRKGEEQQDPHKLILKKEITPGSARAAFPSAGFPVSVGIDSENTTLGVSPSSPESLPVLAGTPVTVTENLTGLTGWDLIGIQCHLGDSSIDPAMVSLLAEGWPPTYEEEGKRAHFIMPDEDVTCVLTNTYTAPPPPSSTTPSGDDDTEEQTEIVPTAPETGPDPADDTVEEMTPPAPEAAPDLPFTGGNYLWHLLAGTALTGIGTGHLFGHRLRRRINFPWEDDEK